MNILDVLDMFFTGIQTAFQLVFDAIPPSAQPYLISICIYSIMAALNYGLKDEKNPRKQKMWRYVVIVYFVIAALYTVWSIRLLSLIPEEITFDNISQFIYIIFFVVLAIILGISFYKQNEWLSKLIIVFIWVMFLITTWIFAPISNEMVWTKDTLYQCLIVGALFGVPVSLKFREEKKKRK